MWKKKIVKKGATDEAARKGFLTYHLGSSSSCKFGDRFYNTNIWFNSNYNGNMLSIFARIRTRTKQVPHGKAYSVYPDHWQRILLSMTQFSKEVLPIIDAEGIYVVYASRHIKRSSACVHFRYQIISPSVRLPRR